MSAERLRITEIFYSLQGESATVGWPTIFIRLTGCPLRCSYCDTSYAFQGGEWWTLDEILKEVEQYQTSYVTVTGGEPLAQKSCLALLTRLSDAGYQVSLETSGALDIAQVDPRVSIVMDIKTPSSGEMEKNLWDNLSRLKHVDQVKLVIANREDYEWTVEILARYQLEQKCTVLFSPVQDELEPQQLADWILEDQLPVRFQIQLHKYLWDNAPGR